MKLPCALIERISITVLVFGLRTPAEGVAARQYCSRSSNVDTAGSPPVNFSSRNNGSPSLGQMPAMAHRRAGSITTCLIIRRSKVYATWIFPSRVWITAG